MGRNFKFLLLFDQCFFIPRRGIERETIGVMQIGSPGELLHKQLECIDRFRRVLLQHNGRYITRRFNQRIFGWIHFLRQERDAKQREAQRCFSLLRNTGLSDSRQEETSRVQIRLRELTGERDDMSKRVRIRVVAGANRLRSFEMCERVLIILGFKFAETKKSPCRAYLGASRTSFCKAAIASG